MMALIGSEMETWPPVPPDFSLHDLTFDHPSFWHSLNGELCKLKNNPNQVAKFGVHPREYQFQIAAGDCAVPVHGRIFRRDTTNPDAPQVHLEGFLMDLGKPIPKDLPMERRRCLVHEMVDVVQRLHAKGIIHGDMKLDNMILDQQDSVKLCDFAEARFVDEDEDEWFGVTTWHYESPNRYFRRVPDEFGGLSHPPPLVEDDLFGLGLSIWELWTGKMPHEEIARDDVALNELHERRETVDVTEIEDPELRKIVTDLLRQGGANIP
ncbi:hypothetical protein VTJ49DRAFT_5948 [Mycothermus thermophilus]|uniref:Protein kinase domain-containing protein n=1 Tax=Humicola insolens TaxID=85995 RepID=A0ABR3VDA3_HUMIN